MRTTVEFCDYLAAKAGATLEYLRFEGKNKVVVRDAAAPRRDAMPSRATRRTPYRREDDLVRRMREPIDGGVSFCEPSVNVHEDKLVYDRVPPGHRKGDRRLPHQSCREADGARLRGLVAHGRGVAVRGLGVVEA